MQYLTWKSTWHIIVYSIHASDEKNSNLFKHIRVVSNNLILLSYSVGLGIPLSLWSLWTISSSSSGPVIWFKNCLLCTSPLRWLYQQAMVLVLGCGSVCWQAIFVATTISFLSWSPFFTFPTNSNGILGFCDDWWHPWFSFSIMIARGSGVRGQGKEETRMGVEPNPSTFPLAAKGNNCPGRASLHFITKYTAVRMTVAHARLQTHIHVSTDGYSRTHGKSSWIHGQGGKWTPAVTPHICPHTHRLVTRRKVLSTFYHTSQIEGGHSEWGKRKIRRQKWELKLKCPTQSAVSVV
jgi:hypothetical protein